MFEGYIENSILNWLFLCFGFLGTWERSGPSGPESDDCKVGDSGSICHYHTSPLFPPTVTLPAPPGQAHPILRKRGGVTVVDAAFKLWVCRCELRGGLTHSDWLGANKACMRVAIRGRREFGSVNAAQCKCYSEMSAVMWILRCNCWGMSVRALT